MLQSSPFLLFDGTCAEAMAFYHDCLGGELSTSRLGETPMKEMFPPQKHDLLINAHLKSGGIEISATDWMASPQLEPVQGNTTAIFVLGDEMEEFKQAFAKLSKDCRKNRYQDLHELPIGLYGQFTDKFGVSWIFLKSTA